MSATEDRLAEIKARLFRYAVFGNDSHELQAHAYVDLTFLAAEVERLNTELAEARAGKAAERDALIMDLIKQRNDLHAHVYELDATIVRLTTEIERHVIVNTGLASQIMDQTQARMDARDAWDAGYAFGVTTEAERAGVAVFGTPVSTHNPYRAALECSACRGSGYVSTMDLDGHVDTRDCECSLVAEGQEQQS